MLIIAKLAGILVIIWFYLAGKKLDGAGVKWALIGLVGYWLTWWLSREIILTSFIGVTSKNSSFIFFVTQIPVVCAVVVAFFVRKKLINDTEKDKNTLE